MNPPKVNEYDYINFLIAAQKLYNCLEAERVQPESDTEGDRHIPLDYWLYEKCVDGATKNDHFRSMLAAAQERGFTPQCVVFDSWYSSLENLKLMLGYGWVWLTRLKRNRHLNPDDTGNRLLHEVAIAATGTAPGQPRR